jgi:tetratricopeptide (TPR) repeat protein
VIALNPLYPRAYFSKARALEQLGNKYEALAAYRHFLKTGNPEQDAALLRQALGRIKALEGK